MRVSNEGGVIGKRIYGDKVDCSGGILPLELGLGYLSGDHLQCVTSHMR